jgi:hypothetical protein
MLLDHIIANVLVRYTGHKIPSRLVFKDIYDQCIEQCIARQDIVFTREQMDTILRYCCAYDTCEKRQAFLSDLESFGLRDLSQRSMYPIPVGGNRYCRRGCFGERLYNDCLARAAAVPVAGLLRAQCTSEDIARAMSKYGMTFKNINGLAQEIIKDFDYKKSIFKKTMRERRGETGSGAIRMKISKKNSSAPYVASSSFRPDELGYCESFDGEGALRSCAASVIKRWCGYHDDVPCTKEEYLEYRRKIGVDDVEGVQPPHLAMEKGKELDTKKGWEWLESMGAEEIAKRKREAEARKAASHLNKEGGVKHIWVEESTTCTQTLTVYSAQQRISSTEMLERLCIMRTEEKRTVCPERHAGDVATTLDQAQVQALLPTCEMDVMMGSPC